MLIILLILRWHFMRNQSKYLQSEYLTQNNRNGGKYHNLRVVFCFNMIPIVFVTG